MKTNNHYDIDLFKVEDLILDNFEYGNYIMFFIMVVPILVFLLYNIINWVEINNSINVLFNEKLKGRVYLTKENIPDGVKYILSSLNIKDVYSIYRLKKYRKIETHFSYVIYCENNGKFHLYFSHDENEKKWFIYKRGFFNNKPIRIKNNYFDILKSINNKSYLKLKISFHDRLNEQIFLKESY